MCLDLLISVKQRARFLGALLKAGAVGMMLASETKFTVSDFENEFQFQLQGYLSDSKSVNPLPHEGV